MDTPTLPALVMDNGSGNCRAGFAGTDVPQIVFPSVVSSPRLLSGGDRAGHGHSYVGSEAQQQRDILALRYPIERGIITHWEGLEQIWWHSYTLLGVVPGEHPVLLTERPLNISWNRERTAQILFETFHSPSLALAQQSVLALLASGLTTGLVMDSGDTLTIPVPVSEGWSLPQGILWVLFSGHDLTNYLAKMLSEKGGTPVADPVIMQDIKEKLCYVAWDVEQEKSRPVTSSSSYTLPDGQVLTLGRERFLCPETLFNPILMDYESSGVHEIIFHAIMKCDPAIRGTLFSHTVLCGGNTLFPGTMGRLQKEMAELVPHTADVQILALPERQLSAWCGGSALASLSSFGKRCISRQEYEKTGPAIVHQKTY
ncbi:actin, muscle-like [Ornithorhynchus anatinus]|uniref:Uncharacterized protein n=1 Tax=Ornithorhynchus anatinus TaxID=9258 RepID=F7EG46_ORNAN|nr:actin, muscle-like [Ornithorhynchus anatinus]